ncbi:MULTISPECIES: class II aldolase/adducin family protein [Acidiplasma]|jgi:L-fuculose-phosphate aldolase|uniref:Fuculose phosphate aldolase n=2 Tax=Acidiplasma TaxID=507753 RepID=A0A0Q0RRV5_9ARCH|nr:MULTISPECIES: class II aldolase/adducin family protein [Acidiplasma]KJE49130.1 fuculose phosphate aldolase [Acidiplasma sp. MBA-1]KPV46858.1 fuculose phosphate aldolase [Acidiplasma aeolicum]KQB34700.1 fuculose phosphate aldolase [Acidiplasma aeolicum]KQB35101.1 fuculose phosphate aldolase [Acidiplasma cupricumulans]WMT54936.1 MAG: class II aldolase/adducin family protein [Acidiplasma sp.]
MLESCKENVVNACKRMYASGFTVGSWGNISMRSGNYICITPSGSNYSKLRPEDIVVTDINGKKIEGTLEPSSERLMHYEIYKKRPDVNFIIHTHAVYSSIFSVINMEIPAITEDVAMILGKSVKIARYALTGTEELAQNVVNALGSNNAAIMANHGAVSVGQDMERAMAASEVLEKTARIMSYAIMYGKYTTIPDEDIKILMEKSGNYLKQWKNWE